jgi:hypothetical protein
MNWLQGYMMAAFDHHPVLRQHRDDFPGDGIYDGIDRYCAQFPAQPLRTAVHELELVLIRKYSPPNPK